MKIAIVFFPPEYSNNNFFSCIENKFPPVFHRIVRNASSAKTRADGCRHFQIFIGNLCRRSIRLDSNLYAIASEHTLTPIRHLLQRDPTALASVKFNYFPFRTPCAQLSRRNWRGIDCADSRMKLVDGGKYIFRFSHCTATPSIVGNRMLWDLCQSCCERNQSVRCSQSDAICSSENTVNLCVCLLQLTYCELLNSAFCLRRCGDRCVDTQIPQRIVCAPANRKKPKLNLKGKKSDANNANFAWENDFVYYLQCTRSWILITVLYVKANSTTISIVDSHEKADGRLSLLSFVRLCPGRACDKSENEYVLCAKTTSATTTLNQQYHGHRHGLGS